MAGRVPSIGSTTSTCGGVVGSDQPPVLGVESHPGGVLSHEGLELLLGQLVDGEGHISAHAITGMGAAGV